VKSIWTVEEVQARLPEFLAQMYSGQELLLTQDGHVVARLIKALPHSTERPGPGFLKGAIQHTSNDFAAPDDDFKDYME
jgi:antitoxin (DNA-binding transcriptional repressor) of toxin-antitoxin stability system